MLICIVFVILLLMQGSYLNWDLSDPELAVAGTILHGFESLYVRPAPFVLIAAVIGIVCTYRGGRK